MQGTGSPFTVLALYRGIAVPAASAESVIDRVKSSGLEGDEGSWHFRVPNPADVQRQVDALLLHPGLSKNDIFANASSPGICACGDAAGAEYYAAQHNYSEERNYPIMIEMSMPLEKAYVDSRDFLCAAFQLWDRKSNQFVNRQENLLARLYGKHVLKYFRTACATQDQATRIAMCNLASFDSRIIRAHYKNQLVIRGRYKTTFRSAFFVQGPISPGYIKRISVVENYLPITPDVILSNFLDGLI